MSLSLFNVRCISFVRLVPLTTSDKCRIIIVNRPGRCQPGPAVERIANETLYRDRTRVID